MGVRIADPAPTLEALRCSGSACECHEAPRIATHAPQIRKTHCPAHVEDPPSLLVLRDEEGFRLWCPACDVHALSEALDGLLKETAQEEPSADPDAEPLATDQGAVSGGLDDVQPTRPEKSPRGLSVAALAEDSGLPIDFLSEQRVADGSGRQPRQPCVDFHYLDFNGITVAIRRRFSLEGLDPTQWRSGDRPSLYGLWRLEDAMEAGYVILVFDEIDALLLWRAGFHALALPGAEAWRPEWAGLLESIDRIYLWSGDTPAPAKKVAADLPRIELIIEPAPSHLLPAFHQDPDAFDKEVNGAMDRAEPAADIAAEANRAKAAQALGLAGDLLDGPATWERIEVVMRELGWAGDVTPPQLAFLACVSRLLDHPLCLAVVAPSAAGKTAAIDLALKLIPKDEYYILTSGSERALIYNDASFAFKVLVIAEADSLPEDGPAASALRSLISSGRLEYEVTEKSQASGQFEVRKISKPGPTALLTSSTRSLRQQMATRTLEVPIVDSPEQTRAVMQAQARKANRELAEVDLEPFHAMQEWLALAGAHEVYLPFADALAKVVPNKDVRLRRDFEQLLTVIKAVALLHQRERQIDSDGRVIATIEDYGIAHSLLEPLYVAVASDGVTPPIRSVVEAVGAMEIAASLADVKRALGVSLSTAQYRVKRALDLGYLTNTAEKGQRYRLVLGEPLPEETTALPTPEALEASLSSNAA